jgi:hypothetical protein
VLGSGIGTSPSIPIDRIFVDPRFSGLDRTYIVDLNRLVAGVLTEGSGIGTSPSVGAPWAFPEPVFGGIAGLARQFGTFSQRPLAAPVGSYGSTLGAAEMPMAPVAPESDGAGAGSVPLSR